MKTFNSMNPAGSDLTKVTLNKFIDFSDEMNAILKECQGINLQKTKTSISISKFIKLRLGDTLQVVILHNERHMQQAQKALK